MSIRLLLCTICIFLISNVQSQNIIDCTEGVINNVFCYESGESIELTYVSNDDSPLNIVVNSGNVENSFDEFIVLDSDGTELYNGYGDEGDLTGLSFQSTGNEITIQVTPDGSIDCTSSDNINPIDISISCATCVNPQIEFQLIDDCINAPQFFIEADVTDLGSAVDIDIVDNQGNSAQTVSEIGVISFGPYPNGTLVELTAVNNQDANCQAQSPVLTQEICTTILIDCTEGVINNVFCYESGESIELTYVSNDDLPLNIVVNSGNVENSFDEFIVLDSDGTELYNGYGDGGDLTGLSFQSTGNEITIQVTPDGSIDCTSSDNINPIDISISCATCIFPEAEFFVVGNCEDDNEEFSIEVDIANLGSSSSINIFDNQGNATQTISELSTLIFGPYPLGTNVFISIENPDDNNCMLTSTVQTLISCACFRAEPFCAPEEGDPLVFENVSDGTEAPVGIDYDCLFSQPNPVWFFLQIDEPGNLDFEIVQNTEFDAQGNPIGVDLDVDFIAWGPFENPSEGCNNLSQETQIDCSFSPLPVENFSIPNAQASEIYIVLITNFNGDPGFISLGQTNLGEVGSGSTNCDIVLNNQVVGCQSDEIVLTAAETMAEQYQWLLFNQSTEQFEPLDGESQPSITITESGVYQILTLIDGEVGTEQFEVELVLNPEINLPTSISLCGLNSEIIDGTVTNSEDYDTLGYQWFLDNIPIEGATSPTYTVAQTGIFSLEITTTNLNIDIDGNELTCTSMYEIEVLSADFTVSLGDNQTICDGDSQTITAIVTGADTSNANFTWSTEEDSSTIEVSESGIYSVNVEINGCEAEASVEYIFEESPTISLGSDFQTCDLSEILLNAQPTNFEGEAVNYEWTFNGNTIPENSAIVNPQDYGFGNYQVNVYGGNPDCNSTDSISISIREDISVSINSDDEDNLFCLGEIANFTVEIENIDIAEATIDWFVDGVLQEQQVGQVLQYLEVSDSDNDGNQSVTVQVTVGDECIYNRDIQLSFYDIDSCIITQGLSPNSDGDNDFLDLRFLDDRSGITSLEIFNRYGRRVYEKTNYRNEFFGQSDNGNDLETGTYFYVIKFQNEDEVYGFIHKGWIYINTEQ